MNLQQAWAYKDMMPDKDATVFRVHNKLLGSDQFVVIRASDEAQLKQMLGDNHEVTKVNPQ